MYHMSENQKTASRKTSDRRFVIDKCRPPLAVSSKPIRETAAESSQPQLLTLPTIFGRRQTKGLRSPQPAQRKKTMPEDHCVVGPSLPDINQMKRKPSTAAVSSKTKEIQSARKDKELKVAQKSSSPVRLPTSDQKKKEQDSRIFRQLRPCTLSPRDQVTPVEVSKLQPTPPPKRQHEGTQHQKTMRASANLSSVTRQPQLQQTISVKDRMEAAAKAWRKENERREETKIEEEKTDLDQAWYLRLTMEERFKRMKALKHCEAKKALLEIREDLLKKWISLYDYRISEALEEKDQLEKIQQPKSDISWKITNELMTEMISEVYEACGGIFHYANINLKQEELEECCMDACKFVETQGLQTEVKQRLKDLQIQKRKEQLAEQKALMEKKREEWRQYRRQKRLALALAPPVVITGKKLMPRSPPPKAVKKVEPVKPIKEDSIMAFLAN